MALKKPCLQWHYICHHTSNKNGKLNHICGISAIIYHQSIKLKINNFILQTSFDRFFQFIQFTWLLSGETADFINIPFFSGRIMSTTLSIHCSKLTISPVWCGSVDWAPAWEPESHQFSSQWVAGQVPSRGCMRGTLTLMSLSLFFSLPFTLSKNKINKIFKKKFKEDQK